MEYSKKHNNQGKAWGRKLLLLCVRKHCGILNNLPTMPTPQIDSIYESSSPYSWCILLASNTDIILKQLWL